MVAFAASCVGLILFLWISFGGSIPLAPQGYRMVAEFNDAVELGPQSDVRISGVSVGKVVSVSLDTKTGLTKAVIQIDPQYAPRPADTRAILRAKSLLGETYVELSPGTQSGQMLPDGGTLPRGQVAPTVQLDQILSTFDPATRRAFMIWQQQDGIALTNRGQDFNAAFAELYPFATNVDSVLAVLHRDSAATTTLLHDGGQVFSALSRSPAQLQSFIRNSNAVFAATAAQDTALADTIRAFPAFTVATRQTIERVNRFATTTKPLIDELRPAAAPLSSALEASVIFAPELRDLMVNIAPLTKASKTGVPAFEKFLDETVPWLTRLTPYLGNLVPVIDYINTYRREVAAFFANSTAATQASSAQHHADQAAALPTDLQPRQPGGPDQLPEASGEQPGKPVHGARHLHAAASRPLGVRRLSVHEQSRSRRSARRLTLPSLHYSVNVYFTSSPGGPPCKAQPPLGSVTTGQQQSFPQLKPLP